MGRDVLLGMLRHALTVGAGGLVAAGYMDGEAAQQIAGGIIGAVGFAWSYFDKKAGR